MGFYLVLVNLPAQLGRIHVFSFLVLVYLKAENISLFFCCCFTAYFSELLVVASNNRGSTMFIPQKTTADLLFFKLRSLPPPAKPVSTLMQCLHFLPALVLL